MTRRILLLSAACGLVLAAGCARKEERAAGPRAVSVRTARAVEKDVPVEVRAVGRIVSNQSVAIRAQVSGPIVAVRFKEGQTVKAGDVLVEIDRRPYAAALAEARAKLVQDRVKADNARDDAKRYAELVQKEFVTRQQYDAARANAGSLDAQLVQDEAAAQRAELNLSYCTIRAPLTGRTGRLLVQEGNLVAANAPDPLLTIQQVRPVYAQFSIPERHLAQLRAWRGAPPPVRVRPDGGAEQVGTLEFMDNAVDATTGTILLKARLENRDEALWPGQVVEVAVRVADRAKAVVVPSAAVAQGQQGDYAYVVTAERKAELRPVVVELAGDAETVVSKGLAAGDTVVTEGQLKLQPGTAVEVLADRNPGS